MDLKVKHKETNHTLSMVYSHWICEIVNKGEANDYVVLEYPDLSQLIIIHPDGKREKSKILDTRFVKEQVDKYPNTHDIIKIDARDQIAKDLNDSKSISIKDDQDSNKTITNNKLIKKSYNKLRGRYRIDRANLDSDNWSPMLQPQKVVDMLIQQDFKTAFKHKPKPYRPYFLWSLWWLFVKAYKPINKLDKQSKRHMTIVVLMILTLIVTIIIGWDNIMDFVNENVLNKSNN